MEKKTEKIIEVEEIHTYYGASHIIQGLSLFQTLAEFTRLCTQRFSAELFKIGFELIDLINDLGKFLDFFFMGVTPEDAHNLLQHRLTFLGRKL